ncbi:hypothetical protein DW790_05495 [Firmicutes bacterium AM31-12AC]|nr:hypothetical protein DW790_05495 [Firmicutes bacterium AM31-12AC]
MLKKTITYTDYNDNERTEDFYFNFSKAELTEMELSTVGGLTELIEKIVNTQDGPKLVKIFKDLVLNAYGEKSADGKRFVKTEEIRNAFAQTEAYSELFMELATDANAASAFINGIMPKDLDKTATTSIATA